ncbi:MAG: hypothetical protein HY701_03700 [Gemmatimonadetes bacterium]|nr:hypothetical protein [Gemmatimonadota bacterium]
MLARAAVSGHDTMLKGSRDAILKQIQPVSVHGQVSLEIVFTHVDDAEGQVHAARLGREAIVGPEPEAGDLVRLEYLVGVVVQMRRIGPARA